MCVDGFKNNFAVCNNCCIFAPHLIIKRMKKIVIIELIAIIALIVWIIVLYSGEKDVHKHSIQCRTELNDMDLKIFLGDTSEYSLCNILHAYGDSITDRDYAFYSFILAEKYNDPFSAQQFADCILQNDTLSKDTAWVRFIIPYLQFAADTFLSQAPVSSESATFWMAQIYSGYLDILPLDTAKASKYEWKYKDAVKKTMSFNNPQ